jgi:hypothetical protein
MTRELPLKWLMAVLLFGACTGGTKAQLDARGPTDVSGTEDARNIDGAGSEQTSDFTGTSDAADSAGDESGEVVPDDGSPGDDSFEVVPDDGSPGDDNFEVVPDGSLPGDESEEPDVVEVFEATPEFVACEDGLPCDDGNVCTKGDQCSDGECVPGTTVLCDDGDPCTDDFCDPAEGCKTEATQDGAPCDDGDACTVGDECVSGACEPGSGICECYSDLDCALVEDGNLCNGTLFCDTAKVPYFCKLDPASIVQCPGTDKTCKVNACNPASGDCEETDAINGTTCDDGDPCTPDSACLQGKCVGETLPACGIGDPCVGGAQCLPGMTCLYDLPGGYCTKGNCQVSGCPFGSTCLLVDAGPSTACFLDCDSDDDCRVDEGYQCTPSGVCACGKLICEPAQPACNGTVAAVCNGCGSGFEPGGTDCSANGENCVAGACVACDPAPCDNCQSLCPPDQQATGPVCGIDGITYESFCKLKCAIGSPECTALSNCHQVAYPFACSDFCVVEEAEPIVVGDTVPSFQCKDLNTSSTTFQAPVSDITLKQLVWIAYFGSCT